MRKRYVTTVVTEWDLRGEVPVEDVNARIKLALNIVMMTQGGPENYAFTGSEHLLQVETVELKEQN